MARHMAHAMVIMQIGINPHSTERFRLAFTRLRQFLSSSLALLHCELILQVFPDNTCLLPRGLAYRYILVQVQVLLSFFSNVTNEHRTILSCKLTIG